MHAEHRPCRRGGPGLVGIARQLDQSGGNHLAAEPEPVLEPTTLGLLAAVEQSWGGDDFAWFTREIPGTYARLGVRDPDGPTLDLHAGLFDVDERAIGIGVRLLVETVRQHFARRVP